MALARRLSRIIETVDLSAHPLGQCYHPSKPGETMSEPLIHSYDDGMSGIFRSNVVHVLNLSGLSADAATERLEETLVRLAIGDRVEASNLPAMEAASFETFLAEFHCRVERWLNDSSAIILKTSN
ncbi:MAG: hypothetical protein VYD57_13020 [Pseudomonadota bacterium]|nr:hypothetical protein [Pseudomonadota bacterium]